MNALVWSKSDRLITFYLMPTIYSSQSHLCSKRIVLTKNNTYMHLVSNDNFCLRIARTNPVWCNLLFNRMIYTPFNLIPYSIILQCYTKRNLIIHAKLKDVMTYNALVCRLCAQLTAYVNNEQLTCVRHNLDVQKLFKFLV